MPRQRSDKRGPQPTNIAPAAPSYKPGTFRTLPRRSATGTAAPAGPQTLHPDIVAIRAYPL
jgi:hypothetical protein